MGLFDIFKKKPVGNNLPEKCSECFRPIDGYIWNLDNKKYCQECYNKRMAIVQQTAGQSPEEYDFEMTIEDVFFNKNHGVVVTGKIHRGVIHRDDAVTINGATYSVTLIDVIPNQVEYAKEGANVGLHLSTMNAALFKRGDVVTAKRFESTPLKNTFLCNVCKKELPIKYRHSGNTCVKCAEARKEQIAQPRTSVHKNEFCLGTFNFTEEDRQSLKAAALRYMPPVLDTVDAQLALLKTLSLVMEVSVVELKTEFSWKIPEAMPDEMKKERFISALVETILSVNQTLGFQNPDFLIKKVDSATAEELLKSWIVLDYYAHTLKPEHTPNIQHFRDYIHNTIQTKFSKATSENMEIPVKFDGTSIYIDSNAFLQWKNSNVLTPQYELNGVLPLEDKEPVICLYEDGTKTREYVLQVENNEDFSGKYFLISVRLGIQGNPAVPVAQIDGFVSDTPEERKMTMNDVGYRFEGHFLACGGEEGKQRYEINRGQDLPMKALKYQGYTTPSNIRLIGVCPDCGKSFCFHGYSFYMAQSDIAYSDDGLDCCEIQAYDIDKDTWTYETEGKCFRYYNSFNCPHCGTPYIDYKKHPENKVFGVSGCVLLGRKHYQYR